MTNLIGKGEHIFQLSDDEKALLALDQALDLIKDARKWAVDENLKADLRKLWNDGCSILRVATQK